MTRIPAKPAALIVVALAFFTDTVVYAMLPPLLPEYARLHGLSQTHLGLLFGSYAGALLLAALPLGAWVDRYGRRGTFLGGLIGFGVATILFTFAQSFPMLLLGRVFQGVAAAATWVAGMALLADHFPAQQRGKAMSTAFASANVALLVGPAYSGWMLKVSNLRVAFLCVAGLAALDALARVVLLPEDPPHEPVRVSYLELIRDGSVRTLAGTMAMGAALGATLEAVLPLHLARDLGMDPLAMGLAFTCAAVGSILTSPIAGHWTDRHGAAGALRLGMILGAGLLGLAAFIPSRLAIGAFMLVLGCASSLLTAPCGPAMAEHVEAKGEAAHGSVFSLLNMAFSLGIMIGPVLGSFLTDRIGLKAALGLLALAFLAYLGPLGRFGRAGGGARVRQ